MDKQIYEIIKATWTFLKIYIQNRQNNASDEYWDAVTDSINAIYDGTEGQQEYVRQFALDLALAGDRLLTAMRKEDRKKEGAA